MFGERDCILTYVYLKEREREHESVRVVNVSVCVCACICIQRKVHVLFCFIFSLRLYLFSAFRAWCRFNGCSLCIFEVLLCFYLIRFHIFIALAEDEGSLRRKARCYM